VLVIGSEMVIVLVVMLLLISAPLYLDWFTTCSGTGVHIILQVNGIMKNMLHINQIFIKVAIFYMKITLNLKLGT
jgi:hypothetical protein